MNINKGRQICIMTLFKMATLASLLCRLVNLILYPYLSAGSILSNIIAFTSFSTLLCIIAIISIKTAQLIAMHHEYFMMNYKGLGLIIESCIAALISIVLFINKSITGQFITFVANLSKQAHSNQITALIIVLILYSCLQIYSAQKINKKSIEQASIKKYLIVNIESLIIKLTIIITTTIGFLHPILHIFTPIELQEFDNIIFNLTTTKIFLYIHTIIIMLLGLWSAIGIYYLYKFYQK